MQKPDLALLNKLKQRVTEIEQKLQQERIAKLERLPKRMGYTSVQQLIGALRQLVGRKPRKKVTDEKRDQVQKLVKAGKTNMQIAEAIGLSRATIVIMKRSLGLSRKYRKPFSKRPARKI